MASFSTPLSLDGHGRLIARRQLLVGLAVAPLGALAQGVRVNTMTRLVRLFLDREIALLRAQRDADRTAMSVLLADDFEQRVAAEPGAPVPRDAWLASALRRRPGETFFEQVAAHDYGIVAVVSFLLVPAPVAGQSAEPPSFVVDTWVRAAADWKLNTRYLAPSPSALPAAASGWPAAPSGKD
jgi:hypothetical protein